MSNKIQLSAIVLLIDGQYGQYVPQRFIKERDLSKWTGISKSDAEILLAGPTHAYYWETWDDVLNNATYDNDGDIYRITQDGDLWAYCFELMTDEEKTNFGMGE